MADFGIMRRSVIIWRILWALALASGLAAQTSPIGPGTLPPTSYESGLVRTPNPVDPSNNLVITGNVRGAKHFRGPIPYGSTTGFDATLGSARLDSFLRLSSVPRELDGRSRGSGTFFSPTATVAGMQPGRNAVFVPPSPRIAGTVQRDGLAQTTDASSATDIVELPASPDGARTSTAWTIGRRSGLQLWTAPEPVGPMERVIPKGWDSDVSVPSTRPPSPKLATPGEYQRQLAVLQRDLDRIERDATALEQQTQTVVGPATIPHDAGLFQPSSADPGPTLRRLEGTPNAEFGVGDPKPPSPTSPDRLRIPERTQRPGDEGVSDLRRGPREVWEENDLQGIPPGGSLERFEPDRHEAKQSTLGDRIDAIFAPRTYRAGAGDAGTHATGKPLARPPIPEMGRRISALPQFPRDPSQDLAHSGKATANRLRPPAAHRRAVSDRPDAPSAAPDDKPAGTEPEAGFPSIGDRVGQNYEGLGTMAQERFDRYVRAAELYMRQGLYHRAAESFALATMYGPQEPLPYLRKAHVLLAAGEYASSAQALGKAIELAPRDSLRRIDLIEAVGGPDPFVERVSDLEQTVSQGDSPRLQVLLAYVYYQMGRSPQAKAAIRTAARDLPASPAIDALQMAISK